MIVPKAPPPRVEEVAPTNPPAGDDVQWVSGYWAWDDDRQDYLWVSGVWRRTPVGREWISGEWQASDQGYRWIPGRWSAAKNDVANEVLPVPPESLEEGPTSEPLSEDQFWVPGNWRYKGNRYVWRPGFWTGCHENWVWVPDYYVAIGSGCRYVSGYWDYGWDQRGTLYAPCYFTHYRAGMRYRPSLVVDCAGAFTHLWVRPGYCHYYFGDYYDDLYTTRGFQPWYRYHSHHRRAYDPLYVHYRWKYGRHQIGLHRSLHDRHALYRHHKDRRPAHKYHEKSHGGRSRHSDLVHRSRDLRRGEEHRNRIRGDVLQLRSQSNSKALARSRTQQGRSRSENERAKDRLTNRSNRVAGSSESQTNRGAGTNPSNRDLSLLRQQRLKQQANADGSRRRGSWSWESIIEFSRERPAIRES